MNQLSNMPVDPAPDDQYLVPRRGMSPALAIMLNDALFERCKQVAKYMAQAEGFIPPHLLGKSEACFAVVTRAIVWKLDPYAVAQCTYQTPGGRVGYEGKLVQAIIESSGRVEGPVTYEHYGDWTKIQGKFDIKQSPKGTRYAVPAWKDEDEVGLGVIVRAQVINEAAPREHRFDLIEAFPRNAVTWATRPKQQICYAAVRAFANIVAPSLFMGVPFEGEDFAEQMRDITPPRPQRQPEDRHLVGGGRPEPDRKAAADAQDADGADLRHLGEVASEADTGPDPRAVAYDAGWDARGEMRPLDAMPGDLPDGLADSWQAGWRRRDDVETGRGSAP